jgi:hypothetical protein
LLGGLALGGNSGALFAGLTGQFRGGTGGLVAQLTGGVFQGALGGFGLAGHVGRRFRRGNSL